MNTENENMYDGLRWTCDECGFTGDIEEFAYIGPKDRDDNQCHPFMEIVNICNKCEEKK